MHFYSYGRLGAFKPPWSINRSTHPSSFRLLPDLILVSAKEASGFRYRPAVDDFVRQVTDVHLRPGLARVCVHQRLLKPDKPSPGQRFPRMPILLERDAHGHKTRHGGSLRIHRGLARRLVAVRWRAILMMPKGQRPQP